MSAVWQGSSHGRQTLQGNVQDTLHCKTTPVVPTTSRDARVELPPYHQASLTREVQIPDKGNAWVQIEILVLHNGTRPHLRVSETEKAHSIPFQIPV
ncbi:hypothetical protein HPB51_028964 [Rhipicephalus microplus]|uniref:Uncharacterized protein n=1 Tax=Rhipicephalus microplus TaxID=6941 RepID=A0A9J6CVG4_RHIMP|nr:hypothetical protein HPB51_028964 [Rhipicephalus microplus]